MKNKIEIKNENKRGKLGKKILSRGAFIISCYQL